MFIQLTDKQNAVLSQNGAHGVTSRYAQVNTSQIITSLQETGFGITSVQLAGVRNVSKQGYQKHIVRMGHADLVLRNVGDSRPEIVIVNSHDGLQSLKIMLGIFRLVCSNGMIVGQTFGGVSIRHVGDILPQIHTAIDDIKTRLPQIAAEIERLNSERLTSAQQLEFAEKAVSLLELPEKSVAKLSTVLNTRRMADAGDSKWLTYQRVQEACLRGGVQYRTETEDQFGNVSFRNNTTRAVKSVDRIVSLNQGLWDLATAA